MGLTKEAGQLSGCIGILIFDCWALGGGLDMRIFFHDRFSGSGPATVQRWFKERRTLNTKFREAIYWVGNLQYARTAQTKDISGILFCDTQKVVVAVCFAHHDPDESRTTVF